MHPRRRAWHPWRFGPIRDTCGQILDKAKCVVGIALSGAECRDKFRIGIQGHECVKITLLGGIIFFGESALVLVHVLPNLIQLQPFARQIAHHGVH
jgi:hypothetical protein